MARKAQGQELAQEVPSEHHIVLRLLGTYCVESVGSCWKGPGGCRTADPGAT